MKINTVAVNFIAIGAPRPQNVFLEGGIAKIALTMFV
jgi:hypothetical protein